MQLVDKDGNIFGDGLQVTGPDGKPKTTGGGGGSGTVTSVGLSMPSAFTVSSSPITTSGTIGVTGSGATTDYIDGTGALQAFPEIKMEVLHAWDGVNNYDYMGVASYGTSPSATTWNITRIIVAANGTTTTGVATGAWTNRASLIYI
jgi:hypothetical protein